MKEKVSWDLSHCPISPCLGQQQAAVSRDGSVPVKKRLFIFFMDFPKAKCEVFFSVLDKKAFQKP